MSSHNSKRQTADKFVPPSSQPTSRINHLPAPQEEIPSLPLGEKEQLWERLKSNLTEEEKNLLLIELKEECSEEYSAGTAAEIIFMSESIRTWISQNKPEWIQEIFDVIMDNTKAKTARHRAEAEKTEAEAKATREISEIPKKTLDTEGTIARRGQNTARMTIILTFITAVACAVYFNDPYPGITVLAIGLAPNLIASLLQLQESKKNNA